MYVFVHRYAAKTYLFKDELVIFELRRNQAKNAELISKAIRGINTSRTSDQKVTHLI